MPKRKDKSLKGLKNKYGATVRKRYTKVFKILKQKRQCPSCGKENIRRSSKGIWRCYSCGFTITGGTYDVSLPSISKS